MLLLFITSHDTGYIHVASFPTRFARALRMIELADAPVTLRLPRDEPLP